MSPSSDSVDGFSTIVATTMLQIPHPIYHSIRHHGEQAYPLECCGILLGEKDGDVRTVLEALICKNVHDRPNKAYSIAPEALVETMRMAREQSLEVIGFYHSHPDHPPQWSTSDLDQAEWVGCSYMITQVRQGIAEATKTFVLVKSGKEKHLEAEKLQVTSE